MATEYDLEEAISLPDNIYEKVIDDYYIIVAVKNPNWLILNQEEYRMFLCLKEGLTIRETLENYYTNYCQDEDRCLALMTSLLGQINDVNFSGMAEILPEQPISSITKKVHIGTTNGCNMHCKHCYMAAGTAPLETIDLQKTIQLVSELHKIYGELEIVVSGGEPLTYKGIETLLKAIKDNHIILFTNGSLISEKNIDLLSECCDEIQISFEGVSREYYSQIRGAQNYDKALHAIELLKAHNKRIVLAVTMLPSTLNDIRDNLIEFVRRLDYSNLEVRISDEIEMSGNALLMDMSTQDERASKEILIRLVRDLEKVGCVVQSSDIRNTRFTNCGIGTTILINYDGMIYPCHKLSDYALKIGTDARDIIAEFNRINEVTSNVNIPKCYGCELQYICSGGCRIDNLLKNGDMNHVICDDKYKEGQYRRLLNDYKMYKENIEEFNE